MEDQVVIAQEQSSVERSAVSGCCYLPTDWLVNSALNDVVVRRRTCLCWIVRCERVHKEAVLIYVHVMHHVGHTPFLDCPKTVAVASGDERKGGRHTTTTTQARRNEDVFYATNHTEATLLELLKRRYRQRRKLQTTQDDEYDDVSKTAREAHLVRHFMLNRRAIVSVVLYGGEVRRRLVVWGM